jgi:HEAT repeat protein
MTGAYRLGGKAEFAMYQYDAEKKLLEILGAALRSDDADQRDAVITYFAMTELRGAVDLLDEYVDDENVAWLKEYAVRVLDHLRARQCGRSSHPPIKPGLGSL